MLSNLLIGGHQRIANKGINVSVGGTLLTTASSVRYLGVTIDPTLSWNLHVSDVVSKVRSRVASILRFGTLSPVILCSLYTAFVLPLFYYCDVV